jgi:two-component system sensor histidine kinase KdpD
VAPSEPDDDLQPTAVASLQSIAEQAAIAIERTLLVQEAAETETATQKARLRETLLSSISHDLRTPLASIVGAASSLRSLGDRLSPPEKSEMLATIEEEAGRLSSFVTDILDMTRLEAGALDVRRDWVDVGDVVQGAVEIARQRNARRAIEVSIGPDLRLVRCDAKLLTQVLLNLLDNADKYSGAGTTTRVGVANRGESIEIVVADDGIGIAKEDLGRVFEKFYRVGKSDGRIAGTGLGLSICRGLVTAMGGTITAESPVVDNRGTRMTIALPIEAAALAMHAIESAKP